MKIGTKFALTVFIFSAFLILSAYVQQQYSERVNQSFLVLENHTLPTLTSLLEALAATRRATIKAIEFAMHRKQQDHQKALEALAQLQLNLHRYSTLHTSKTPDLVDHIQRLQQAFSESIQHYLTMPKRMSQTQLLAEEENLHATRSALIKTLYPLINQQYQNLNSSERDTSKQLELASNIQLISILVISSIVIIGALILARLITHPLNKLNEAAEQIGQGNLDIEVNINSKDEVGQLATSFRRMTDNLKQQRFKLQQEIEKLRTTELKLRTAQRIAQLGNWEYDIPNNKVYWSDQTRLILGQENSQDIATFEHFLNLVHPLDRAHVQQAFEQSLANQTPYEIEHRLLLPDGTVKYLYGKGETQYSDHGKPLRTLGTVQDITAQKKSDAIMQRMNRMFEHSVDEIYIFDGHSLKFLQVSQGALDNLGYSQQEIETLTPVAIMPDYNAQAFNQLLRPLSRGEQRQLIFEARHQRKDGSVYPVEVRLQYTLEDIMPVFLAIVIDLTERKKVEAELEQHRHRLEKLVEDRTAKIRQQARIIDQTHDSVITVDLDGIITSWNGGAERLFGMQSSKTLGQPITIVYPAGSEEFLHNNIIQPVLKKGNHEVEVRLQHADGRIFPAHLSLTTLHDAQGRPTGIVGYSIDLSEIRKREQQLDRLSRKLQESNKELEAFSYSVSHDLRSPLRSIDGFSQAIVEDYADLLDDTGKDYLSRVRKAAQRMGILIDELLELSRVNRAEIKIQTLNLNQIARQSFEELAANHPERKVRLELGDDMQLQGDARLCTIVMDNLIGNAWKFTAQQANPQIIIKPVEDNPKVFYIRDNGVGFDMRHADKLFGAFQRLHQSNEFPGTGVGLATVLRIINRHGGRIWAESEPGKGATFYFTLQPEAKQ